MSKKINDNLPKAITQIQPEKKGNLFIVRHGETEWNRIGKLQGRNDSRLTETGKKQAIKIGKKLQIKKIKLIFSSPLNRAQTTAHIIAEQIGAEVKIINEFREMDFGEFEGIKKEMIKEKYPDFFEKRKTDKKFKLYKRYPKGESYHDLYLRIKNRVQELLQTHTNFIIVGHECLNKIIRGIAINMPLEEMVMLSQKNNEFIEIDLINNKEYSYTA